MRKLASIRRIADVFPIEGADRIELVQIDGWQCIAKKGEFKKNDLCVYFEIDSFLPDIEIYKFLGKTKKYAGKDGHRIRTIKMRGQISQGLALPLSTYDGKIENTTELTDLTEVLGVIKYDTELINNPNRLNESNGSNRGNSKGFFPSFIPKTDQERIQNLTSYWKRFSGDTFEETLKLDGSSMTCYKIKKNTTLWSKIVGFFRIEKAKNYHFGVCSRNIELQKNESNFWKAAIKYNIENELPLGFAIQGELIAPNIQSNHEKVKEVEYYVFSVFDIQNQKYLAPEEKRKFIEYNFNRLGQVLVINEEVRIFDEESTLDKLLKRVEGESMNPGTTSEGRVYVSTTNPTIHFKCISNKYLLKEK